MSNFKITAPAFPNGPEADIFFIEQPDGSFVMSLTNPATGTYPSLPASLTQGAAMTVTADVFGYLF